MPANRHGNGSVCPPLRRLYAHLTDGCNLACRHCWQAPKSAETGAFLPVAAFRHVVAQARPLGLEGVKLTGGEPLLHPDFSEFLDAIRAADLALTVETNGVLCTEDVAAGIAACRGAAVSVSIDGADAATHARLRGEAGSFKQATQAVRYLVRVGVRTEIITTLHRGNADQVDAVVRMAEDLGAGELKFNVLQPVARGAAMHRAAEALSVRELIALARYVYADLADSMPVRLLLDCPPAFRPLRALAEGRGRGACQVRHILGVIPDGDGGRYALCGIGRHVPELVFGSVCNDRLATLWRAHPGLVALRDGLPDRLEGVCSRCLMKGRCLGYCVAQNHERAGRLWAPNWFCEAAEKEGLFPASRQASTV